MNSFYTVVGDYTAGTRARGAEITTEFDSIEAGFDAITNVPTANAGYSGMSVTATVDTNATGLGAALYMASDGNFDEADADSASTMPCRALAVETGTGSKIVLLQGFLRVDAWNWTPGGDIYVDTTTGGLTQTAPSGTGDQVQVVGFAWDADTIYFLPGSYSVEEV